MVVLGPVVREAGALHGADLHAFVSCGGLIQTTLIVTIGVRGQGSLVGWKRLVWRWLVGVDGGVAFIVLS